MPKRVAVVTGTSTGIGLDLAIQLSQRNYVVIGTTRDPAKAPPALTSVCDVQPLDVTEGTSTKNLATYIEDRYGRCDVLINNAGFAICGNLESMSVESAKRVFDVNVWGVMRMCQLFVPLMRRTGGGLVITVSSTSGLRGLPCADIYTASKMAVQGMMESFRYSVEQDNIKVAMVNPGPTDTPFYVRMARETSDSRVADPYPKMTDHYARVVGSRNAAGQSAGDCARSIVEVVEREINKDVREGGEVYWINGTSDYAKRVIERLICSPDGHSGEFAGIYKDARAVVARLKREESQGR